MMPRKFILITATLLLLSACGGEDSSPQTSNSTLAPLAGDAFEVLSKDGEQTTVSLRGVVIDPQGLPLTLESVVATGQSCEPPFNINAQALTFTVDNVKPELCSYRYSVKNHPTQTSQSKTSEANSYVLKSASASSLLPPLSETTQVGTPITITIAAIAGYTLDSEVVVLGDGGSVADSTASTIAYTPNAQGVTRLVYTMTSDDGTDMMTGTIDVAVSDVGNRVPDVEPILITKNPNNGGYYGINQSYKIDLSSYISSTDADGDDVQLIQVKAWNANVALYAPDDPTNLSFNFRTSEPGVHYVTYVVSDHRGGYGVEQVRIEVYDLNASAIWDDITQDLNTFSAPLTFMDAYSRGLVFSGSNSDSINAPIAVFDHEEAVDYCQLEGRLPTSEELKDLFNLAKTELMFWPVDKPYWTNVEGAVVSLKTGQSQSGVFEPNYVTCISDGGFIIVVSESTNESVIANGISEAKVVALVTQNDRPVENEIVTASVNADSSAQMDSTVATTDVAGKAVFNITNYKAETVTVTVSYGNTQRMMDLEFVSDPSTATLSLEIVTDNQPVGGGVNKARARLIDENNNLVSGQMVEFSTSDLNADIVSSSTTTNDIGEANTDIIYNGVGMLEAQSVLLKAKYQYNHLEQSQEKHMTYLPPILASFVQKSISGTVNATVTNVNGIGVASMPVKFSVIDGDCSIEQDTVYTNDNGDALNYVIQGETLDNCLIHAEFNGDYLELDYTFALYNQLVLDEPIAVTDTSALRAKCDENGYVRITGAIEYDLIKDYIVNNLDKSPVKDWNTERIVNGCNSAQALYSYGVVSAEIGINECYSNMVIDAESNVGRPFPPRSSHKTNLLICGRKIGN